MQCPSRLGFAMIAIVATVRAPEPDLRLWVAYHRNVGVDRLHLYFDDPADPALPAISVLPGVVAIACTADHWRAAGLHPEAGIEARQTYNANLALERVREESCEWLLHIDSDELLFTPCGDLAGWLAGREAACEAVGFPVLEAVPPSKMRRHVFQSCTSFKRTPRAPSLDWARRAGCRQALRYGYFRGHTAGKAATRLKSTVDHIGIHAPARSNGAPVLIESAGDAFVLHYDGCTFESWREKWVRRKDGSGLALNMRPDRMRQFQDFLAAEATGSLAELEREFRSQRLIPAYERAVLRLLGLTRPVHLPQELFAPR